MNGNEPNGRADQFALLEARHVDNLTEAVRMLNRSVIELIAVIQKQLQRDIARSQRKAKTKSASDRRKVPRRRASDAVRP